MNWRSRALWVWCAFGLAVIAIKAHLDRTVLRYDDVAVRAAGEVYYIPRTMIETSGWRADVMRLAGCWDAREGGLLPVLQPLAGCGSAQSVRLAVAAKELGIDAEIGLRGKPLTITFWPDYVPPGEHLPELIDAWGGQGQWSGRRVILRADWQLFRVESPNSPWVHLLSIEPVKGDAGELEKTYAGRCYRPEQASDAGITCTFVLRVDGSAAIEYSLGPDEIMSFVAVRDALMGKTSAWRKADLTAPDLTTDVNQPAPKTLAGEKPDKG